jgi:pyruvate dehydrogenase E2 component (dihydrolipoamide acetyltransferase)
MAISRRTAADVTTVTEVDMTELAALRKQLGVSYTACVSKATVEALGRYPILNSSLQGDKILLKKDINLGIAVAITDGLLVPVLKTASRFSVQELDAEIDRLSTRARNGQLAIEEMSGGTFTLTNSGAFGTLFFTPIINHPEAAILGMGKVREAAVVRNQQVDVGLMMYLCLSYDHRIVDGAVAAEFLQAIKQQLENPRSLLAK